MQINLSDYVTELLYEVREVLSEQLESAKVCRMLDGDVFYVINCY